MSPSEQPTLARASTHTGSRNNGAYRPIAVMLHADMQAAAATLADAWRPVIPAAELIVLDVARLTDDEVSKRLKQLRQPAGLTPIQVIAIGVYGAQDVAVRMAFGQLELECGAILAVGSALPAVLAPLAVDAASRCRRLRIVWETTDPLQHSIILGELLACFRSVGIDTQGAVFGAATASQLGQSASATAIRMGGAYLAELVALALTPSMASSHSPIR